MRAGRFVSRTIRALRLRLTPKPYSTANDYWHKKHNYDGVNSAGDNKDREYFALLVGPYLLTFGVGNSQTLLTRLRMTTH